MLRSLADRIDTGEFGDPKNPEFVIRCVSVLRVSNRPPIVMGFGEMESIHQAFVDLHAGAAELLSMQHPERS